MVGKSPNQNQRELFRPLLKDFIDMSHELVLMADKIDWSYFEREFSPLYSHTGRPSNPIRLMVSLLLLKHLYNLGDETLAKEWVMNPYMQYFSGMSHFEHKFPTDPSDLVHFRKRIGKEGIKKIFQHTVSLHGDDAKESIVMADTTVQENNITYPTDAKLYKGGIDKLNQLFKKYSLPQRQSYVRVSKQLLRFSYNSTHPRRAKNAKKSIKKLHVILGRLYREFHRVADAAIVEKEQELLHKISRVLEQNKYSKDKIYSYHKPYTACISKGKPHKKYEFGNKIGIITTIRTLIITGVTYHKGNPHDSNTISGLLSAHTAFTQSTPKELLFDRGGRGVKQIGDTKISIPSKPSKKDSVYQKRRKRKLFRRRAAIEPVISHLKSQHRMLKNYLWDEDSPLINALLAASAWNLKKLTEKLKKEFYFFFIFLLKIFAEIVPTHKKSIENFKNATC